MTYNDEQFQELAEFEESYLTAQKGYARPLRRGAIERIAEIHRAATGSRIKARSNCGECALRVLRLVGTYWLADKDERAARAQQEKPQAHKIGISDKSPKKTKKTVKTAKKGE